MDTVRAVAHVFQAVGEMLENQPKYFKEPSLSTEVDPIIAYQNNVYQAIKNAFALALGNDGKIKINVDNIYQLFRALGLNPQSELVIDLVREALIENIGDIDPKNFERVVLSLVRDHDVQLWNKRLDEKEHLRQLAKQNEAQIETERQLYQERENAGFQKTEKKSNEWEEYERQKRQDEEALRKEMKEDELYDNIKMAFRFIDADKDCVISTQDMHLLMMALGDMMTDDELFGMINMADLDCDGKVTFEDFKRFLLPCSGDESLVHSPDAYRDKNAVNKQVDSEINEIAEKSQNTEIETVKIQSEERLDPASSTTDATVCEANDRQLLDDEKKVLENRKRSVLYWYTSSSKTSSIDSEKTTQTTRPSVMSEDDDVFLVKSESCTPVNKKESEESQDFVKLSVKDNNEDSDQSCLVYSIIEDDEHLTSDVPVRFTDNTEAHAITPLISSSVKSKYKQYSHQNISILKSKFTNSFGSSGDKTMDSNSSEIRDQNKGNSSDISDADDVDTIFVPPQSFAVKRSSPISSQYDFAYDNDDEDMVEAHYVQESLSRVSSKESLNSLNESSERILPDDNHTQSAFERTRNVVRNYKHGFKLELTEEQLETQKQTGDKLNRAFTLQKAIFQRSFTTPSLTMFTSNKGQQNSARSQLNVIACSRIDINPNCDSPPKADIKSLKQLSVPMQSVRTSRNVNEASRSGHKMSFVDVSDVLDSADYLSPLADNNRWPVRPLTRPRSSKIRKLCPLPDKNSNLDIHLNIAGIAESSISKSKLETGLSRRAVSAAPFRQSFSSSTSIQSHTLKRPQTANMPYTARRQDYDELFEKLVAEPLSNSDELYPNKSLLTTFHHGFKTFWPIGRKINAIKNKRTFELNSYSRAIERNQFPFKSKSSKANR